MRKREQDAASSTSGVSRTSMGDKSRKPPRFSLRRLFYRARPPSVGSHKSIRAVSRSHSENESRSESSFHSSPIDKDAPVLTRFQTFMSRDDTGSLSAGSHGNARRSKEGYECPVCLTYQPRENFPAVTTCHHRSCRDCLQRYLRIEITESRINIACPECSERFHPNDIKMILEDPDLMCKYEEFMLRRVLVLDSDARWCPAPDCGYAVIASGCASCPKIKCERPGCETHFCYHCKQYWHPNQTCDAARAERSSNLRSSSMSFSHESSSQSDIKPCPRCAAYIVKMDDGSCNHMTCAVCGAEFCWLCMKEISDLHYLSPSGCTFWGKKPWSRKKKILWQLGTLVGAPVGISLIAGIAVPAIIIGLPVWVGRRLHSRYDYMTKHRRNLVVAGGVSASILVSPILAGLAVGIGVPILLAYVYGVVPISLCRSGGCGVTTNKSGGVRFEFDDDNEAPASANAPFAGGDTQSMETTSHVHVTNPSLGPSIGEMSMGLTNSLSASGSHMDRVGVLRDDCDRDSSSNRAMVGASLNGSLSGSTLAGPSGLHRLEVQAELASGGTQKRSSLSSESANFSMDAKSATVSFSDDASTRALAGSICNRDKDNHSAIMPPMEVQVDVTSTSACYHSNNGVTSVSTGDAGAKGTASAGTSASASTVTAVGHGSPTSSRSVNFLAEEVLGSVGTGTGVGAGVGAGVGSARPGSSRRYKRQSVSIGDSIHEHAAETNNLTRVSGISFTDGSSPDLLPGGGSLGGPGGRKAGSVGADGIKATADSAGSSSSSSVSMATTTPLSLPLGGSLGSASSEQGLLARDGSVLLTGLTEVESDHLEAACSGSSDGGHAMVAMVHGSLKATLLPSHGGDQSRNTLHCGGARDNEACVINLCDPSEGADPRASPPCALPLGPSPHSPSPSSSSSSSSSSSACETTVLINGASSSSSFS